MAHTPGPWTIELCGALLPDDRLIIGHPNTDDPRVIRTIGRLFNYCGEDERDANARLIAAAPSHHDALKAIATARVDEGTDLAQLVALWQAMARTEIAKAE